MVAFKDVKPFPHTVLVNEWPPDWLADVAAEFPDCDDPHWITYPDPKEFGKRAGASDMWGPATKHFMNYLRSSDVVSQLEHLTSIDQLTPDDIGGGMHMTCEGGRLDMHVDFNTHPSLPLIRRLNLLVFLNDTWDESWGGVLRLGQGDEQQVILPLMNHTVIFETSDFSWHGHPEPIVGNHQRKSIAMYYYTPMTTPVQSHSTVWMGQ